MDELNKIIEEIAEKTKGTASQSQLENLKRTLSNLITTDKITSVDAIAIFKDALGKITKNPSSTGAVLSQIPELLANSALSLVKNIAQQIADPRVRQQFMDNFDIGSSVKALANATNAAFASSSSLINDIANSSNIGNITGGFTKLKGADFGKSVMDKVDMMINTVLDPYQDFQVNSSRLFGEKSGFLFGENVQSLTPGVPSDRATGVDTIRRQYMDAVGAMQGELYIDEKTSREAFETIYSNIRNVSSQLSGFKIKIDDKTTLDSFSSIKLISDQLGVSIADTSQAINTMTSRWGMSGESAQKALMNIARGAAASNIPAREMFSNVENLNSQFDHLGDMTSGVTASIAQFAAALGPNRMSLALDSVKKMVSGIANMSDEMKAFITMGSQLGGGGSAIEGIVRLEEAIASGDQDKLREIQEEFAQRIEELSGGPLLTQKEAVETGQEERFYMQAKIAQQMGLSENRVGYSAMVEGLRGPALGASGLEALGGSEADLLKRQQMMMLEVSPTAGARGKMRQFGLEGAAQIAEGTIDARRNLGRNLVSDFGNGGIEGLMLRGQDYSIGKESKEAGIVELGMGAGAGAEQHISLSNQRALSGISENIALSESGAIIGTNSNLAINNKSAALSLDSSLEAIATASSDLNNLTEETAEAFRSASEDLRIAVDTFNKASELIVGSSVKVHLEMSSGLEKIIDARIAATRGGL